MKHEPFDDQPDPDETPDDKQLNQLIDEELARLRPDRYDADDKEWMDEVVAEVTSALGARPAPEILHDAARRRVYHREGVATKRLNKMLRNINDTLGCDDETWREFLNDALHLPLSIDRTRVRFGAAGPDDLKEWELQSGREQDKRNAAEAAAREGVRLLADLMRAQNATRIEDLRATSPEDE